MPTDGVACATMWLWRGVRDEDGGAAGGDGRRGGDANRAVGDGVPQGATVHEESCTLVAKESSKGIGIFSPDP
ncbi:hypothetical protein NL676_036726 [Syzygium grande]|nr:hypothetical protein NL676_036726 [Syzygium grande]